MLKQINLIIVASGFFAPYLIYQQCSILKGRCGMIDNETTLQKRPYDTEINK